MTNLSSKHVLGRKRFLTRSFRFTLIELLVTIAVIAILAAMLMPSLSRVRYKAKMVVCMNNLKQVGMTFHHYAGEYNSKVWLVSYYQRKQISYYIHRAGPDRRNMTWGKYLYNDYLPRETLFCPLVRGPRFTINGAEEFPNNYGGKHRSSYIQATTAYIDNANNVVGSLKTLTQLAGRALVADYLSDLPNVGNHKMKSCHQWVMEEGVAGAVGTNVAYTDGHVNFVPLNVYYSLAPPSNSAGYNAQFDQLWNALSNFDN